MRGVMRLCGPGSEGTEDGAWRLDGTDASPRCPNADRIGANADAGRSNV